MATSLRTTDEPLCPKCGGQMWNNVATKKNPKAPDYRCRDRGCDGVVWPPKGEKATAPAPQQKQGFSSGPRIQQIDGPIDMEKLERLVALYGVCLSEAIQQAQKLNEAEIGTDPQTVAAIAATIYIQACKAQ